MEYNTPFWYKIAHYWHYHVSRHGGPTIPFVLGVQYDDTFKEYFDRKIDIPTLLTELTSFQSEEKIFFKVCTDLKEYVLGIYDKLYPPPEWSKLKTEGYVILDKDITDVHSSYDEIVSFATETYQPFLDKKLYSKREWPRQWNSYSTDDIKNITSALVVMQK